jgi:hypothetical protein|tara:strand:+ start:872 stop:1018 length:147 start_codon:yes stop_codon:yes gene_type:complete
MALQHCSAKPKKDASLTLLINPLTGLGLPANHIVVLAIAHPAARGMGN